jgi:amino-acid N-acetyltransferase
MTQITVRKPTIKDAPGIQKLIQHYAERKFLLPRTINQVAESLRDFFICEQDGRIVGCGALHLWSDLAEVRSLAVAEGHWRKGIGTLILNACLQEARELGVKTVFVLTYQPDFFERVGFKRATKEKFPQKIWVDCANCPQFPNCTEVALIMELESSAPAARS